MLSSLAGIPNLQVSENVPLSQYTRFAIGGAAGAVVDAADESSLIEAFRSVRATGCLYSVVGGGTNLIVNDAGFPGIALRYTAGRIVMDGTRVYAEAGAVLQELVDSTIDNGLRGLDTMTGIPGWVGGAIYGNAGAYGHSINERIRSVRFFDGARVRAFANGECQFHYRESIFKENKDWIILSAELELEPGDPEELSRGADEILKIRNAKYPPTMRCAGSIFKNLLLDELPETVQAQLPERVIRERKVASAYFLEKAGAKGMKKGDIHVADYHANLIYNAGRGTARELCEVIDELKARVWRMFRLELQEEVQYVGFAGRPYSISCDETR